MRTLEGKKPVNQPSASPERIVDLSNYLRKLGADVVGQGKVAKIEGNPVLVAAVALLSGGIAMFGAMVEDLKVLSGNAKVAGRPILESLVVGATAQGVGRLFDKLLGK